MASAASTCWRAARTSGPGSPIGLVCHPRNPSRAAATSLLPDAVAKGELRNDADIRLLVELICDAYLSNYRRAAYDNWDAQALSDHLAKQIDVILAGALAE